MPDLALELVGGLDLPKRMLVRRTARFQRATGSAPMGISDEDLAAINEMALKPLTRDDVIVRTSLIANDQPDSYFTQFSPPALEQVARLLTGCPVMRNHSNFGSDDLPVGRWFRCWNERTADGVYWAGAAMYMIREPLTESLVARMDGGVISETSLSWWMSRDAMACSICGQNPFDQRSTCQHMPGETYGERMCVMRMNSVDEVDEASLVWKGGQYGTSIGLVDAKQDDDEDDMGAGMPGQMSKSKRLFMVQRLAERTAQLKSAAPAEVSDMQRWWDDPDHAMRSWFKNAG